jgi:hypothetical protein
VGRPSSQLMICGLHPVRVPTPAEEAKRELVASSAT